MRLRDVKEWWKATKSGIFCYKWTSYWGHPKSEAGWGWKAPLEIGYSVCPVGRETIWRITGMVRSSRQIFTDLWKQNHTLIMSRKRDTHLWKIKPGWILLEGKLQKHFWSTFDQRLNTPCRSLRRETLRNSLLDFPLLWQVSLCKFVNWINSFCSWGSMALLLET